MMRLLIGIIIVPALLAAIVLSCDKDEGIIVSGGSSQPSNYPVESEPSVSPDGKYVYFVARDTTAHSDKNGIYRAAISAPRREHLVEGWGFHSPTASFSGFRVAFLVYPTVSFFDMVADSVLPSKIPLIFEAMTYVNDSIIVGSDGLTMLMVNHNDSGYTRIGRGTDPTYYAPNRVVALTEYESGQCTILRYTLKPQDTDFVIEIDTLGQIITAGTIRWVSIDPSSGRYVYVEQLEGVNSVYTSQLGTEVKNLIAETDQVKALMLEFNMLIYSGPDGRFYQSNFEGTSKFPFWHAEPAI